MRIEQMSDFFTARVGGYDEHMLHLYSMVFATLKAGGQYIEGDYMVIKQEDEDFYCSENQRIRKEQGISDKEFYHHDTSCIINNQIELLSKVGFNSVKMNWRAEDTTIIVAQK